MTPLITTMSVTLDPKAAERAKSEHHVSAPFGARAWAAIGDVVGESAAASLLQYSVRSATTQVALRAGHPTTIIDALSAAAEGVPFTFKILSEAPTRVELTWRHALVEELPPALRMPFTRGLFQGALAASPAGNGWGVMVMDEPQAMIVLARGIA